MNRDAARARNVRRSTGHVRYYVYALLGSGGFAPRLAGARIAFVPAGDLFAAVERVAEPPRLSEAALRRQHQIVVALSHHTDAILPVRFGAVLDADELAEVVRLRRTVLHQALRRVRGQEQMTLRILGAAAAAPPAPVSRPATGTDYLRGRLAASRATLTPTARPLVAAVRPLVTAQRIDRGRGAVQLAIHHLVPRGSGGPYTRHVEAAAARMRTPPEMIVSGPWPPFAFTPDIWSSDRSEGGDSAAGRVLA
jgi:hypothetical protein